MTTSMPEQLDDLARHLGLDEAVRAAVRAYGLHVTRARSAALDWADAGDLLRRAAYLAETIATVHVLLDPPAPDDAASIEALGITRFGCYRSDTRIGEPLVLNPLEVRRHLAAKHLILAMSSNGDLCRRVLEDALR